MPDSLPDVVKVLVSVDSNRQVTVTPDPVVLRVGADGKTFPQVMWEGDGCDVDVQFNPDDTPFPGSNFRAATSGSVLSGPVPKPIRMRAKQSFEATVVAGAPDSEAGTTHKYSVVAIKDGVRSQVQDPDVKVIGGGVRG